MTEEQIFKLASEHLYILTSVNEWCGENEDILKFAHQIRKQTLEEVISVLQNVPNPEANRAAINRIEEEIYLLQP